MMQLETTDHARSLADALSDLIRVVQFRDRDRACCYDLSVSQCYALSAVVRRGPLTVNDLAAHLFLDKSTASRVARGLEERGLVERRRDPSDRRLVHLVASPAGRALTERIEADLEVEFAALLQDFDPEVRDAVVTVVRNLARSFAARVDTGGGTCCSREIS